MFEYHSKKKVCKWLMCLCGRTPKIYSRCIEEDHVESLACTCKRKTRSLDAPKVVDSTSVSIDLWFGYCLCSIRVSRNHSHNFPAALLRKYRGPSETKLGPDTKATVLASFIQSEASASAPVYLHFLTFWMRSCDSRGIRMLPKHSQLESSWKVSSSLSVN